MYYITRIIRGEHRSVQGIYVKDTKDGVEEYLTKDQFMYYVNNGIEIAGYNKRDIVKSAPAPQMLDPKMKLLMNVDVEVAEDGTIQYLSIPLNVTVKLKDLGTLGEGCIYGGRGIICMTPNDRLNYSAFINYQSTEQDILRYEFGESDRAGMTQALSTRYGITLILDGFSNEQFENFCNKINFTSLFLGDMFNLFDIVDKSCRYRLDLCFDLCYYYLNMHLSLYNVFDTYLKLIDKDKNPKIPAAEFEMLSEFFDKHVLGVFRDTSNRLSFSTDPAYLRRMVKFFGIALSETADEIQQDFGLMPIYINDRDTKRSKAEDKSRKQVWKLLMETICDMSQHDIDEAIGTDAEFIFCMFRYYALSGRDKQACEFVEAFCKMSWDMKTGKDVPEDKEYIIRVIRDDSGVKTVYVRRTSDLSIKEFSYEDFQYYLRDGAVVEGVDNGLHPVPLNNELETELYSGLITETSQDGDIVQYVKVKEGVNYLIESMYVQLADGSIYGGGGIVKLSTVNTNYNAFCNYWRSYKSIRDGEFGYLPENERDAAAMSTYKVLIDLNAFGIADAVDVFKGLRVADMDRNGVYGTLLTVDDGRLSFAIEMLLEFARYTDGRADAVDLFGTIYDKYDEGGRGYSYSDIGTMCRFFEENVIVNLLEDMPMPDDMAYLIKNTVKKAKNVLPKDDYRNLRVIVNTIMTGLFKRKVFSKKSRDAAASVTKEMFRTLGVEKFTLFILMSRFEMISRIGSDLENYLFKVADCFYEE